MYVAALSQHLHVCIAVTMERTLVRKGKNCIATVESLSLDISKGHLDAASRKLNVLKEDGIQLATKAEQRAKELEIVEEQYLHQVEEVQRQIGELGCKEEKLRERKLRAESALRGQEATLSEMQGTLSSAERSLREAERIRHEKEEEEKSRRTTGAVAGAVILGLFTFGAGAPLGAALGVGIGEMINQLVEAEETARREVERCRNKCQSVESDIESTKHELSSMYRENLLLTMDIEKLKLQRYRFNEEALRMKEGVLFFRRASVFWQEFKQISEHGVDRTSLVQRIICKAKEKQDLSFLNKRANRQVGMTFLEAWEMMEAKCEEGLEFMFHIEY